MTDKLTDPDARRLCMTVPTTFRRQAIRILRRLQFDAWLDGYRAAQDMHRAAEEARNSEPR